jgi:Ulp1 family protease
MTDQTDNSLVALLKEYIILHNELVNTAKNVKNFKERKEQVADAIKEIMKQNNISSIPTANANINYVVQMKKSTIKKDHLLSVVKNSVPEETYNKILEEIKGSQQETEIEKITISKN